MKPRTLSTEEEAELARSNKKVKDSRYADFNEGPSEGSPLRNNHNHWSKENASFRDKLVGEIPGAFAHAFDFTDLMDAEYDSDNDDEETSELREGQVAIKLSKDTKKRLRERWSKAVIVKLVGRSVSFSYMQSKLNLIWKPEGRMDVVDLSYGFFLVRFFSKEDLNSVLKRGPWFLGDHFLSLRPWEPFFKPSAANISLVAVWIRLYELPLELYEAEVLREIGESIGKVLRVDMHTAMEARGKYARLCIQIDINKPLINSILIGRFEQAVNYEGIQKLCFSCGRLGHLKEACPYTVRRSKESVNTAEEDPAENVGACNGHEEERTESTSTLPAKSTSGTSVVEEVSGTSVVEAASCQYGPWMIVTRKRGGYKGKNSSQEGSTKSVGKSASHFTSNNMQFMRSKAGPSPFKYDAFRNKTHVEVGSSLNNGTLKNSSLGLGPNLKLNTQGKPDATFVSNTSPLPGLTINKRKNPHSVRGKKAFARNIPGNPPSGAVTNPFQGLSSKLSSLSASTSSCANHEAEMSPSASFKFMAPNEEGVGASNSWEGDRRSSGEQRPVQSKDQVQGEAGQLEEEKRLGVEDGGAGIAVGAHPKIGSNDEIGEVDRMVSEEGDDANPSF
nr:uncharacterized protein CFP56_65842 [Quercus suber]